MYPTEVAEKNYPTEVEKIYPTLEPTAPVDDEIADIQKYRIEYIRDALTDMKVESEKRKTLKRRYGRVATAFRITSISLGAISTVANGVSVGLLSTGVGVVIALPLSISSLCTTSLALGIDRIHRFLADKKAKHDTLANQAKNHISSLAGLRSRTLDDGEISATEFHHIQQQIAKLREEKSKK